MATSSKGTAEASFSSIVVGQSAYLNLKKFSLSYSSSDPKQAQSQMVVAMINGMVGSFENKWILATTSTATSAKNDSFSSDDFVAIRNYMTGMSYVASADTVGKEVLQGVPVYHLKVSLQDSGGLTDLIKKMALEKSPNLAHDTNFNKQMTDIATTLGKKLDMDVWIGQNDFRLYKAVVPPMTFSGAQASVESTTTASYELSLSDYNKNLPIVAPKDYMTLESLMKSIFGGLYGAPASSKPSTNQAVPKLK